MKETIETMDWRKQKRNRNGSIRKNADGSFSARVQWIDEDGKRRESTRKVGKKSEARSAISQISEERRNHGDGAVLSDKMKFSDLAGRFEKIMLQPAVYDEHGKKILGLKSIAPRKSALKPLVAYFGRRAIREIRYSDLESYKKKRLNTPVVREVNKKVKLEKPGRKKFETQKELVSKPRTIASVNRELQLLRQIFRFAKSDKILISSPFDDHSIISAAAENERQRVMSLEEENRLIAVCVKERAHLRPLIIVAVQTAMRRGELFKLSWRDVNFADGIITVLATNTKTEQTRMIAMTSGVREGLNQLWEASPKDENLLVFGITNSIKRAWKTACNEAKIADLRFHDLRHTATTRFIRAGTEMSEAMKITGHSQLKTFQRYMNLTHESVKASAELLDAYLNREANLSGSVQELENVEC